jgi:hypothetical protein
MKICTSLLVGKVEVCRRLSAPQFCSSGVHMHAAVCGVRFLVRKFTALFEGYSGPRLVLSDISHQASTELQTFVSDPWTLLLRPPMSTVLLLRAPSQDGDRYEDALRSHGYHPISVPVLETVIFSREELARKLSLGPVVQGISGVIITSKRAVEAWCEAAQALLVADQNAHSSPDSGVSIVSH